MKLETVREMYENFISIFPEISNSVDEDRVKYLDDVGFGTPFYWFECLANYINKEMIKGTNPNRFKEVFEYFRSIYHFGNSKIKECIDVSFTENLFHDVHPSKAKSYWIVLPDLLKDLYTNFHRRSPL